jgi:type III secretion protein Q
MELADTAMLNSLRKSSSVKRLADNAPPALTRRAARFARLLADARLPAWLERHGITEWRVGAAEAARFHEAGWIELRHGFAHASAAIDLSRHPALAAVAADGSRAGNGRPVSADDALRHAVAAALLEPLTARFADLGFGELRVAAVHRGTPPRERSEGFAISLRTHDDQTFECVLTPPDDTCLDALEACIGAQRLPLTPALSTLRVPGRLALGTKTMRVKTVRSLRAGDVVLRALDTRLNDWLITRESANDIQALWGTPGAPGISVPVRVGVKTMTLIGEPTMTDVETDVQSDYLDDPTALDVNALSLPIHFEIDTVPMPVSQLTALRPGYVVELTVPLADSRIRLSAHGQTLGFGELVTVGDQLGVRILEMSHGNDSVQ